MNIRLVLPSVLLLSIQLLGPVTARAQWVVDGTKVSAVANGEYSPTVASDGSGGAIITWYDYANGVDADVYVQRLDASGTPQWAPGGVPLCTLAGDQQWPQIIADGSGGAVVVWQDTRNGSYDLYTQRVDASGNVLWTTNGQALCTAINNQISERLIPDGSGGAIITWQDYRTGVPGNYDIYAQRISGSGAVQWTTNGVGLCTSSGSQDHPAIASDGAGGAIVTWMDFRTGANYYLYAQRVSPSGAVQWATDGIEVSNASNDEENPSIVPDGSGGAIIAWNDLRNGTDYNLYAQRINAAGVSQWTANDVPLCTATNSQTMPLLVPDGSGGAIAAWLDVRNGTDDDLYAQRITGSGLPLWNADGVVIAALGGNQNWQHIVSDGSGGAIISWNDNRNGNYDIYAQRIDATGASVWSYNGSPLSTATGDQQYPALASDGAGNAFVTWEDRRSGISEIYAQRVEGRYGYWGHPEPVLAAAKDNPNDQGGKVILNWAASGRDVPNQQFIYRYTIWRAMDAAAVAALNTSSVTLLDKPVTAGAPQGAPIVWHERTMTTDYYWELVGTQDAYYYPSYSFTAPTRQDSTGSNPATEYFRVTAEAYSQFYNWPSNVLSAHSVDNLAPAAPLYLTAQRNGADVDLMWNGVHVPDLKDYAVYRATSSGVTPVQGNFLINDADTVLVDSNAPTSSLYYIVTAYDVHQNQSKPSNEASVSATTNVGKTPSITALTVLQNRPNPFSAQTELEIGLPAASEIEVDVYDVAGHRVRKEEVAGVKGWQAVRFAGLDDRGEPLASGMYFYRISAHGETVTRKMLITR